MAKRKTGAQKFIEKEFEKETFSELERYNKSKTQESQKITRTTENGLKMLSEVTPKNEKQLSLLQAIHHNDIIFVTGVAGVGKAQPLDALVMTPSGYVKMGDITIGDDILTPFEGVKKVIGVFPQGMKQIYKVKFSDGTSTECCGEHLWNTKTYKDRNFRRKINQKKYPEWVDYSPKTTYDILNSLKTKRGDKNHSIPLCNPIEFDEKEFLIHPYLMGALLGDGGLTTVIGLSNIDQELIDKFHLLLPKGYILKHKEKCDYTIVNEFRSNHINIIKNEIVNLGLFGKKSDKKFIPKDYLFSSVDQRIQLLRGLMDSDGYLRDGDTQSVITTTSEQLSCDIKFLVESLGGYVKMTNKNPKFTYNGERKNGLPAFVINCSLPKDINPFFISRKSEKYKPVNRHLYRYIVDVEKLEEKECQCILIDSKDHLYMTNDLIVTHNTLIALKGALEVFFKKNSKIQNILLTKPIVEAAESLGFLPGTQDEKTEPYMHSFYSNIKKLIGPVEAKKMLEAGTIKPVTLAYMRGVTFTNSIAILDEAQNTTKVGLKLFLSRIGENSKVIIMGDMDQTDLKLKYGEISGLEDAFNRFQGIPSVAFVEFDEDDIVRHTILIEIMKRYKE